MSTVKKSFSSIAHNLQSSKKYFAANPPRRSRKLFSIGNCCVGSTRTGAPELRRLRSAETSRDHVQLRMPATLVNRGGHKAIAKNGDGFLNQVIAQRVGEGDFDSQRASRPSLQDATAATSRHAPLAANFPGQSASRRLDSRAPSPRRVRLTGANRE